MRIGRGGVRRVVSILREFGDSGAALCSLSVLGVGCWIGLFKGLDWSVPQVIFSRVASHVKSDSPQDLCGSRCGCAPSNHLIFVIERWLLWMHPTFAIQS